MKMTFCKKTMSIIFIMSIGIVRIMYVSTHLYIPTQFWSLHGPATLAVFSILRLGSGADIS